MSPQSFKILSFLLKPEWWHRSLRVATGAASNFLMPAAFLAAANVASFVATQQMYALLQAQELRGDELPGVLFSSCAWIFAGLALIAWALALLLIRLTALARAYLEEEFNHLDARRWQKCLSEVKKRKLYLLKLWSLASVYLLAPLIPFSILSSVKAASSPMFSLGTASVFSLPPWAGALVNLGLILCAAVVTGYSLVVLVLSAGRLNAAGETAWLSVRIYCREALALTVLSAGILAVNTAISTPQALFSAGSLEEMLKQSLYSYICWQGWFALTSSVLWPLSIIAICEPLRKELSP